MSTHYRQVTLNEAAAGMVLSDDLRDAHGQILLTRGSALTEGILASLQRHGIVTLAIVHGGEISSADEEAELVQCETRLARLFRKPGNDEDDATAVLQQYVRRFRLGESS